MAKRKSATALFEVIQAGKLGSRPAVAASLRTPWWFKKRDKPTPADVTLPAASDPDDPTANVTAAHLARPRQAAPATSQPPLVVVFAEPPPISIPPLPRIADPTTTLTPWLPPDPAPIAPVVSAATMSLPAPAPAETPAFVAPPAAAPPAESGEVHSPRVFRSRNGMQVAFDGDKQEMTLRMRYTAAIVSGCTVLAVVGLAYVIGRHMAGGPQKAAGSDKVASAAQVKKGPIQPNVMDVSQRQGRATITRGADPATANDTIGRLAGPTPVIPYVDAKIGEDGTAPRLTNFNYLIIRRYPADRADTAEAVRAYFTNHGIPCTVETAKKGSTGLAMTTPGWHCVVGTRGFQPPLEKSKEYQAYLKAVVDVAAKFPDKSKVAAGIQPQPFKWTE